MFELLIYIVILIAIISLIADFLNKRKAEIEYHQKKSDTNPIIYHTNEKWHKPKNLNPDEIYFSWHNHDIIKLIFEQQNILNKNYELRLQVTEIFLKNKINCLYHITDKANYESIKKKGCILSRKQLNSESISFVSSRDGLSKHLDDKLNLNSYIHLCFNPYLPIFWKLLYEQKRELIVFKSNPAIATLNTVLFSNKDSLDKTSINATYDQGGLDNLDFPAIFSTRHYGEPTELFKQRQAELLIPDVIPQDFIINFDNPQHLDTYIFDSRSIIKPDIYYPFTNKKQAVVFDDNNYNISLPKFIKQKENYNPDRLIFYVV